MNARSEPSEQTQDLQEARSKIIGMGDRSMRKTYYRELRGRIADLERFRLLLEESSEMIFLLEAPSGRIVDLNVRASELISRRRAESVGMSFIDRLPPDLGGRVSRFLASDVPDKLCDRRTLTATGQIVGDTIPDRQVEVSVHRAKIRNRTYAVAVLRDITERMRAEALLKDAKMRAENAAKARSEFISIASHELRTPLTALRGLIQISKIILNKGEPVCAETLDRLLQQVDRLNVMINDLLTVSRLERGVFTMNPEDTDLRTLLADIVQRYQTQVTDRQISLEVASDGRFTARVDPGRIEQVVANLLDNAVKYSPEGKPVRVRLSRKDDRIQVEVHDAGAPLGKEQEQRLFDMFSRVKSDITLRKPGLGLGLYICREIIGMHRGSIGIQASGYKSGNTFFFELPVEATR